MTLRGIAFVAASALLGATAHATVIATSGYGAPHAYVTLAIAGNVAIAAVVVGVLWSRRRRILSIATIGCIVAGELFGLITTAERLMAAREAVQAPLQAAAASYANAARRVAEASAALSAVPVTSPRLEAALTEKRAADAAASEKSVERGGRDNCRQL